jgi:hypothetical protein
MKDQTPLNDLLNLGTGCDWITPLYVILRDAYTGSVTHFGVYAHGGFDRGAIRRLLSTNGVESWGYIYNVAGDLIMFSVRDEQATRAAQVLEREGVPVLGGPADDAQSEAARPSVVLGNSFRAGNMTLIKAPSIWELFGGLLKRLIG